MKVCSGNAVWMKQLGEPHWYVVRSNSNQERLARMSLKAEGFDAYLPQLPKLKKRTGDTYSVPLFIGYLFVRLTLGEEGATRVFSTRGVSALVGNGVRPSPIADMAIHRIRMIEREAFIELGLVAQPIEFEVGQPVTIETGPLAGFDGTFAKKLDAERCQVLLKVIGDSPRLARISLAALKSAC